ncbi:MAG: hypothetical protein EZS28_011784 [Streblomastix strix]|uniref:Uncharacterized protein n=1 Tax=Streblomastix strix TaxID=222440 RepID=A0A5J4WEG8_9EUKA|nr:MAG: hypothetical protein EZS28_011784 [Streblomastix strix]
MAAVMLALRSFQGNLMKEQVEALTLQTDNQSVEYSLRQWKATPALMHLVQAIFQILATLQIQKQTIHIPGLENKDTNSLSRLSWKKDFSINPQILIQVMNQLNFLPEIDLFAIRMNKLCQSYCSMQKDRHAVEKRGAFCINWSNKLLLVHPLNEIILRVLKKLKRESSIALMLMPQWCEEMYRALFPTVMKEINLGPCDQALGMGKSMKRLELKLPPGNLIAVQLIYMQQESNCIEICQKELDSVNKQSNN